MHLLTKCVLISALVPILGACGIARRAQEAREREENLDSAIANCKTATYKTRLEYTRCVGNAEENFLVPGSPIPDLIRLKIATRNSIAERYDAGKLTRAEAELETAKAASELTGEVGRRSTAARIAQAQENAADAAAARNKSVTCFGGPQFATCY